MAGWDEDNVLYSDQQLEDNDVNVSGAAIRRSGSLRNLFEALAMSTGHFLTGLCCIGEISLCIHLCGYLDVNSLRVYEVVVPRVASNWD